MFKKVIFAYIGAFLLLLSARGNKTDDAIKIEDDEPSPYEAIVLNEHHPFYLDDVDNAIYFARGHSKEQIAVDIIGGKTYRAYGDETIIFYSGYQHQGIISDIQIYLSKADRAIDLNQLME